MKQGMIAGMFVIAAVAGVTWSASAQAADFPDWPPPPVRCRPAAELTDGRALAPMAWVLGLSDTQKEKIEVIVKSTREKDASLFKSLTETRGKLQRAMHATTVDVGVIRAAAVKKGELEADLIISHAELRSRIDGILTPEQRIMSAMLPLLQPGGPERGPFFEREQMPALGRCGQGGLEPAPGRPTTADGDWEPEIFFERR